MTLQQKVSAILADIDADWVSDAVASEPHEDGPNVTLAKRIYAAVLEEREACAKVADSSLNDIGGTIARRIRERK